MKKRTMPRNASIFLFFLLLISHAVLAGVDPPVLKVLQGTQIHTDSTVLVEDSKFFDPAYSGILVKPYTVRNKISFKINESANIYFRGAFRASVQLRIFSTRADNSVDSSDRSFDIAYNPDSAYTAIAAYPFTGAYRVKVKVLSATTNVSWNVWNALSVENELQSIPSYTFSCTNDAIPSVSFASLPAGTGADELPVSWPNKITADEYDLEWAYIDSSALTDSVYGDPAHPSAQLIFDNNATRVTITGTGYNIPLIYDNTGSLFFRVRAAQVKPDGSRFESNWSSDNTAGLGWFRFNGHQRNLNWQSTTSFAEEGKRKVVVQYYDGSLRSRQTVTKDNTTNTTIVSESYYDYQGRPVIQVLPSPTLNSVISYSQHFNMGLNGAYDKDNFDRLIDPSVYCNTGADPMTADSGAARYYSPNNPLKDSVFHQFIPDAGGYPFTETEYTQDNTGRISRQGGVGANHQLGSGHETKYFYGTPDQRELDALFGTEVGDHSHYYKTMVRDANGQYSISYTDMHGRTIATALAGSTPDSIHLDKLSSYDSAMVTETLSDPNTAIIKDLSMESQKGLLVEKAGLHTFTYRLNPASVQINGCDNTPVCYDCLYDLEITITDDCNNQKLPGGQAFDTTLHSFSLIDTTCSNGAPGFSFSFSKYLVEGSYDITKRLSVSRHGMAYYRDSVFAVKNTCKTLQTFINEQRAILANVQLCKPTCQSCQASLGTLAQFSVAYKQKAGIAAADNSYDGLIAKAYANAQSDCNELCNQPSAYDDIRKDMLLDLTPPSGQYANPGQQSDVYSIFYAQTPESPNKDTIPDFIKPRNYKDAYGNADLVYDEEVGAQVAPWQLSMETFVERFKLSWAEALLPYHPEYSKLQQYEALKPSANWDTRFGATDTYLDAMKKGYLNPTGMPGAPYTKYAATEAADIDSIVYFSGHNYKADIEADLLRYRNNTINSSGVSIWSMANIAALCNDNNPTSCLTTYTNESNIFNSAAQCTGDLDMAWRVFRQMYLDIKQDKINAQLKAVTGNSSPTAQVLLAAGHQPHFSDATELLTANGITLPTDSTQANALQQQKQAEVNAYYDANCRAYVAQWFQQLAPCHYTTADTAVIMPLLVQVCRQGSDAGHPYGSSSVAPASTPTYKSFEEVINAYNASHNISNVKACNAYLITDPRPYNAQLVYSTKPIWSKPDACECSQITRLHDNYLETTGYTSFSQYLQQVYQTTMTDSVAGLLLSLCSAGNSSACTYLPGPIDLPGAMQCNTGDVCADCNAIGKLYDSYRNTYSNALPKYISNATDSEQLASNTLFEHYMNHYLGFSMHAADYLAFLATCNTHTGLPARCDSLQQVKNDYIQYNGHIPHLDASGADTTNIKLDFGGLKYTVGVPLGAVINNGVLQLPRSYSDTVNHRGLDFDYVNDTLCIDTSGFTLEMRLKLPDSVWTPNGFNSYYWLSLNSNNKLAGDFLMSINPTTVALITHLRDSLVGNTQAPINVNFNDWRVVKFKIAGRVAYLYLDGVLLVQRALTAPVESINYFGLTTYSVKGAVDYIRIYDTSGHMYYDEEFNDAHNLAYPTSRANCTACDTRFATYFNNRMGTSYSAAQVDSVYATGCGVAANPCSSTTPDASCSRNTRFIKTYGGANRETINRVRQTADGGYIVPGQTNSFGAIGFDAYLAKTNAAGLVEWSKKYGKEGDDVFSSVLQTAEGGYIAVGTINANLASKHSEIWVVKTDAFGTVSWSRRINAGTPHGETGHEIIQTSDGGYALTGYYNTINNDDDWMVLKLDGQGNVLWNKVFGTHNSVDPGGLLEEGDSLVVTAFGIGTSLGNNDHYYDGVLMKIGENNGTVGWLRTYDIDKKSNWFGDIRKSNTGYSITSVMSDDFGATNVYACAMNVSSDGTVQNAFKIGGIATGVANGGVGVSPTADGGFIACESPQSNGDIYLQKCTNTGTPLWTNRIQLPGNQQANQTLQTADGSFVVAGTSDNDFFLVKTDTLGHTLCADAPLTITNITSSVDMQTQVLPVDMSVPLFVNAVDTIGTDVFMLQNTVCINNPCSRPLTGPTLCGRSAPVFPPATQPLVDNCSDSSFFAVSKGTELYHAYRDSLLNNFDSSYRATCMQAYKLESFTVTRSSSLFHFTLYYYDQAGNLVKTIAPQGVQPNHDSAWLDNVAAARAAGQTLLPGHLMPTQYRYNTLNQVVTQQTPDAGASHFWYDRLGRLVISQNARQAAVSVSEAGRQYSYTQYDYLGRIAEVGQVANTASNGSISDAITRNEAQLNTWLGSLVANKEQVTRTIYDQAYPAVNTIPLTARNLRNRVAYTTFTTGNGQSSYNQASFYSYDIHGNVDTLLQDYGSSLITSTQNIMNANNGRWKRIVYQYDLISGKVNQVACNPPYWDVTTNAWTIPPDAFYHRYSYDAENRLTLVETSADSVLWEKDARYEYYLHGPLARTTLGDQQVQGMDYAYTIQGWLKGVNSSTLRSVYDMGADGSAGSRHQYVAKDALGFNLNYFAHDYASIKTSVGPFANAASLGTAFRPLYNGNISSMAVNIGKLNQPYLYNYHYDQLNRLTGQDAYTGLDTTTNSWSGLTATNAYKERVQYDANGNILHYDRYSANTSMIMDSLTYHYTAGTNKLSYLSEASNSYSGVNGTKDIEDQPVSNYGYDAIGNLTGDSSEHIPTNGITWNVYGKITSINRSAPGLNSNTRQIAYVYDAAGNRIGKKTTYFNSGKVDYTWYLRDAQGNTLQVYNASRDTTLGNDLSDFALQLSESYIFGSSRVGELSRNSNAESNTPAVMKYGSRGYKFYEIANHLGNVLTVISDKKRGIPDPSDTTRAGYYTPDIIKATDYYPFGMLMSGRDSITRACHDSAVDNTIVAAISDLNSGATTSGNNVVHNGVSWQPYSTGNGAVTLYNQAIKVDATSTSGGVVALFPAAALSAGTVYLVEFDITEKSSGVSSFFCQLQSQSNAGQPYRVLTQKTGPGHYALLCTLPATYDFLRLRISSVQAGTGQYFVVDNLVLRKMPQSTEAPQYATDFGSAVMSGVNVNDNGQVWVPYSNASTSLSISGTTDKKLKVTPATINESQVQTDFNLAGGKDYIARFSLAQDSAGKRIYLDMYSRTASAWTLTDTRSVIYLGSGDYMINFSLPAGTDGLRLLFRRSTDAPAVPYTIDNLSLSRLDTVGRTKLSVCPVDTGSSGSFYRYGFNGKENDRDVKGDGNQIDFGERIYDPRLGKFLSVDPLSKNYPEMSNYSYAQNSPIYRIDVDGNWDVTVHAYNDRKKYGYGIAIVSDRHGNEVFRFKVRLEGVGGRDRLQANGDTPLGTYDIPNGRDKWITGKSRLAYGPNARLSLSGESGEIQQSGRSLIRVHGGRQETPIYNKKGEITGWEPISDAELKKTHGCLRTYDNDVKTFKEITDRLEANDKQEAGGKLTIVADLQLNKDNEPIAPPVMKPSLPTPNPEKALPKSNTGVVNKPDTEEKSSSGLLNAIKGFLDKFDILKTAEGVPGGINPNASDRKQ